jgi:precorrin-6Y C5,15-methyltransferase (decarboxylating)
MKRKIIHVVGVGDDGCASLNARAFAAIARSRVLAGGERQLAFFPDHPGLRMRIDKNVDVFLTQIEQARLESEVCVLASGDPLFYGIGKRIMDRFGRDEVEFYPQPTSVALALARIGLASQDVMTVSFHGRLLHGLVSRLEHAHHFALLTDPVNTPQAIAAHLLRYEIDAFRLWIAANLGGPDESVTAHELAEVVKLPTTPVLNVVVLQRKVACWRPCSTLAYLDESVLECRMPKRGLVTKREVRCLSLAAMRISRDAIVWDIGTGSGSVAIEAAKIAYQGSIWAVDCDEKAVEITNANALAHRVDNLEIVHALAPIGLDELPRPDCVFVGGTKGAMDKILDICFEALQEGGWIVVNTITLENCAESFAWAKSRQANCEIVAFNGARAVPLATYMRYEAQNPVQILAVQKVKREVEAC